MGCHEYDARFFTCSVACSSASSFLEQAPSYKDIYYPERGEEKGGGQHTTTPNADCFAPADPIVDCPEADREIWEGRSEGRNKVQWH